MRADGVRDQAGPMAEKLTFVRLLHATTPNTRYSHTSTSRRHETHMPPTIEPTVPDEMDWKSVLPRFLVRGLNLLPTRDPVIWDKYYSAVWKRDKFGGWLESADRLPSNRLNQLLNVDRQKTALVRNVDNFLQGLPSNNVLLWGGRGTGKSSMILSLLAEFSERGLRLLEVKKDGLEDLSEILRSVSHEPYKFIIYQIV